MEKLFLPCAKLSHRYVLCPKAFCSQRLPLLLSVRPRWSTGYLSNFAVAVRLSSFMNMQVGAFPWYTYYRRRSFDGYKRCTNIKVLIHFAPYKKTPHPFLLWFCAQRLNASLIWLKTLRVFGLMETKRTDLRTLGRALILRTISRMKEQRRCRIFAWVMPTWIVDASNAPPPMRVSFFPERTSLVACPMRWALESFYKTTAFYPLPLSTPVCS